MPRTGRLTDTCMARNVMRRSWSLASPATTTCQRSCAQSSTGVGDLVCIVAWVAVPMSITFERGMVMSSSRGRWCVSWRSRDGARHTSRNSVVFRIAKTPVLQLTMMMSRTPIARTRSSMTTRKAGQRSTRATAYQIQWMKRKTTLTSACASLWQI